MTIDSIERSVDDSRPIELYDFEFASGVVYRLTSSEDKITFNGNDYLSESIERDRIVQGAIDRRNPISIRLPGSNPYALNYTRIPPSQGVVCTITRTQRGETDGVVIFKGDVKNVAFVENGRVARIIVQSVESFADRQLPRFAAQSLCNHQLYDRGCGVNPTAFTFNGIVSAEERNVITVTGSEDSGLKFKNGFVTLFDAPDMRFIVDQDGDDLRLLMPFGRSLIGLTVTVRAGCDHVLTGDCTAVFSNQRRFGGFPYVPHQNPFVEGFA